MAGNSADPGRSVASKVTAILMAFADRDVLTLTEIAGAARLPSSTAHRLASELLAWRLLERNEDGTYRIGLSLLIIGKDATDFDMLNRAILVRRARPMLAALARTVHTEARLGVLNGDKVAYLSRSGENPADAVTLTPALPAHATAIGKALLAFSPTGVVDRVVATGMQATDTATSPNKLRHALAAIRLTQIATVRDEYQAGRSAIAMPVFSGGGRVAAAVELTLFAPDTDIKAATGALTVACRSLSRQLATELHNDATVHYNGNGGAA